MEFRSRNDDER
ncbi:hypothetical protein L195_g063041, partial [Trifolium pratense]